MNNAKLSANLLCNSPSGSRAGLADFSLRRVFLLCRLLSLRLSRLFSLRAPVPNRSLVGSRFIFSFQFIFSCLMLAVSTLLFSAPQVAYAGEAILATRLTASENQKASGNLAETLVASPGRSVSTSSSYQSSSSYQWFVGGNAVPLKFSELAPNQTGASLLAAGKAEAPLAINKPNLALPVPTAPTITSLAQGNGSISLTWTVPTGTVTSYTVKYSTFSGGENSGTIIPNLSSPSNTVPGLANGTTYYFVVTATNSSGTSVNSAEASQTPAGLPPPPAQLQAVAGNATVQLNWPAVAGAGISYSIFRGTTPGNESPSPIYSGLTTTSQLDTGLTNGTTYYYTVTATSSLGQSVYSAEANATPILPSVPAAPFNLVASAPIGSKSIQLNWVPSSGATSYSIYRGTSSGSEGTTVYDTAPSNTYTDTGVAQGTTYYYVVRAVGTNGTSAASNEASSLAGFTSLAAAPGPAYGQVSLNWLTFTGTVTYYTVQYGTQKGGPYPSSVSNITSTAQVISGLTVGTPYYFVVNGTNQAGTGANSNEATAFPAAPTAAPILLTAVPHNQCVSLSWSSVPGATSYVVQYGTSAVYPNLPGGYTNISGLALTSTTVNNLTNGTSYYFQVVAVNAGGPSGPSSELLATPVAPANPVPVLTAVAGNGQVTLNWTPFLGPVSYYTVLYGTQSGGPYPSSIADITATTQVVPGLTNGTPYYFVVNGTNQSGTGGNSAEATATPTAPIPAAPTGLTATGSVAQVTLNWTASAGATSYNIYRSTISGAETLLVRSGDSTHYLDGAGVSGTTYYYKVSAVNSGGESPLSNEASAVPLAPAPGTPTLAVGAFPVTAYSGGPPISPFKSNVVWRTPSNAATYQLFRSTSGGTPVQISNGSLNQGFIAQQPFNNSYIDPNLSLSTRYSYFVTVTGPGGTAASSTATYPSPLPAPTAVTATSGNAQIALSWTASAGATSYNIYRSTTSGTETILAYSGAGTSYPDTTAVNGTPYYYVVTTVSAGGEGPASTPEATATPHIPVPAAPVSLVASGGGTAQIALSWGNTSTATSYNIYRGTSPGGEGSTPIAKQVTAQTYYDNGLTYSTTYYYQVTGVNAGGEGAKSNEASATTAAPVIVITQAAATPNPGLPCAPTVFTAAATDSYPLGALTYIWNFGDGSATATGSSVSHTYAAAGSYQATVTVTDSIQTKASLPVSITIGTPAITISSASATAGVTCAPVVFSATASENCPSGSLTYAWSFGDGSLSAASTSGAASHQYAAASPAGGYTATVTVTDSFGGKSSQSVQVTVALPTVTVTSDSASPSAASTCTPVVFTALASENCPSGSLTYTWSFGDGSTSVTGTSPTTSHQYSAVSPAAGYTVTLTVQDTTYNVSAIYTSSVVVTVPAITISSASFYPNPAVTCNPVVFTASASESCASGSLTYAWTFGDGSPAVSGASPTVQHQYAAASPAAGYSATLTITDSFGGTATKNFTVVVNAPAITISAASATPNPSLTSISTTFSASASENCSHLTALLNWGAVTSATGYNVYRGAATGGPYSIIAYGVTGTSFSDTNVVTGGSYYYVTTALSPKGESLFSNEASPTPLSTPPGSGLTYAWTFGDGSSSAASTSGAASHQYAAASPAAGYTATVTVTDSFGGKNTKSLQVIVTAPPTLLSLVLSPTSVSGGESVMGTVKLSGPAPQGGATVTLVSGNTSVVGLPASQNVVVQAQSNTASFILTTNSVSVATPVTISATYGTTKNATVTVNPPVAMFAYRVDVGNSGNFTDSSGNPWTPETGLFQSGTAVASSGAVNNVSPLDAALYQTQRVGASFTYTLSVPNGNYLLALLFAEVDGSVTGAGQRVCTVTSNGLTLLSNFDTYAAVGPNMATTQVVPVTVTNGSLVLTFTGTGSSGTAAVAALQLGLMPMGGGITPYIPGVSQPVPDVPAPGWGGAALPTDGSSDSGGMGPSMGGPVSLASGVEENQPGPDLWSYNPLGPAVSYERIYRSQRPSRPGYGSPGLSPGWTDSNDMSIISGSGSYTLYYPNDGTDVWNGTTGALSATKTGTPYLMTQTPASGGNPATITMTQKDRSRTTFTQISAAGGNYAAGTYLMSGMTNLVGHFVTINRDTPANGYRVLSLTNDAGTALLTFSYAGSQLASVMDKDGRTISYGFSGAGNLASVSQINAPGALRWQYGYVTSPVAGSTIPLLSSVGAPDPSNPGSLSAPSVTLFYDRTGAVASHMDAVGNKRAYTYVPSSGGAVQVTGVTVTNANGIVAQTWKHKIGPSNVEVGTVDAGNHATSTQYYGPYLPNMATNEIAQAAQALYDSYGNPTSVTDPRGIQISTQFSYPSDFALGQPAQVQQVYIPYTPGTLPNPSTPPSSLLTATSLSYYGVGSSFNGLVSEVDTPTPDTVTAAGSTPAAPGIKTQYSYDTTNVNGLPLGNVSTIIGPSPNGPLGTTVSYAYITPSGTVPAVTVPALGEPVSVTVTGTAPSAVSAGLPTINTQKSTFTYDSRGNTLSVTDASGYTTSFLYNLADQQTSVIYPATGAGSGGAHTDTFYQYLGGPAYEVVVYDENGNAVREVDTTYDAEGQVTSVTGSTQPSVYAYDGRGRVVQMTDGNSHATNYAYDPLGNLSKVYYPNAPGGTNPFDTETYSYDTAHNLTAETDGRGLTTAYSRINPATNLQDPDNLVYAKSYLNVPASVTSIGNVSYSYDVFGRRSVMADGTGTTAYNAYDDNDALQSMTRSFAGGPQSQTLSFAHNPDGSRRVLGTPGNVANPMTAINGGSFSYLYDGMGRLAQLNVPFTVSSNGNPINGAAGDYLQHQYQANGWLAQTNGLLMGMAPASSTVTYYNYNPRGFLTSLQNYQQNGSTGGLTNSSTFTGMGYDAVGNRLALSASIPAVGSAPDASRSVSFAYDTAHSTPSQNRDVLTGEASAGSASYAQNYTNNFGYDGAYNPSAFAITGSGFSYPPNVDNQINVAGFSFDGDGNPTTYKNAAFSFDPEDRLTAISSPAFSASYDGDGLRATKTATPIGGSGPVTTYFLYDGTTPVLEETAASGGTITAVNVEAADGIRARYSQTLGSQFYGFTYDPQGSLTGSQYSANGFTAGYATSSFEAYGHRGGQIGNNGSLPSNQPPFEFGGQYGYYTDVETGLLCLTHRYYDPGTGKFINRDPIGYAGGQNLYGFADGNPVNEMDPNGTSGILIFVHGTLSNDGTWTPEERHAVERTFRPDHVVFFSWAYIKKLGKSGTAPSDIQGNAAESLDERIADLRSQYPGLAVAVVAHSNGGNVAVAAAQMDNPPDLIVRLGSPPQNALSNAPSRTEVFDIYDKDDGIAFGVAKLFGFPGGVKALAPAQANWHRLAVISPDQSNGASVHLNMHTPQVWRQLEPTLMRYGHMERFGR